MAAAIGRLARHQGMIPRRSFLAIDHFAQPTDPRTSRIVPPATASCNPVRLIGYDSRSGLLRTLRNGTSERLAASKGSPSR